MTTPLGTYWQTGAEDAAMQEEHEFVWRAMLRTIDVGLVGRRVLDAGYDPASGAITDARRLAGELPLVFEIADSVPGDWGGFDVAFSHEVLYLIHDVRTWSNSLRPRGFR